MRDRRVLHEIVPTEDHRTAELLAEGAPLAHGLEVLSDDLRAEAAEFPIVVGGLPRVCERLLVHVGRVDLDALTEVLRAQDVGQRHRE